MNRHRGRADEHRRIRSHETGTAGGTYRTAEFPVGFSFTIPDGWSKHRDYELWAVLGPLAPDNEEGDNTLGGPLGAIVFLDFGDADPDWVVEDLLQAEGVEVTEPVDIVIGGAPGQTFDISAVDVPASVDIGASEYLDLPIPLGPATPIYVLRVAYRTVLIYVEHPGDGGEFRDEAQAVLDTIGWRDLS